MHAIDCVTSIIDSGGTMYSRSGGSPSGSSHGVTRWIFFQWTASMSTIRSLITGMLPIGSTVMTTGVCWPSSGGFQPIPCAVLGRLVEVRVAGQRRLAVDAHAAGAADRGAARAADADRPVLAVLGLEDAVEHRAVAVEVDRELLPVGRLARLGGVAAELQRVFGHGRPVLPFLGLPLGHGDRRVGDLRGVAAVDRQVDVLEPLVVVALGEVEPELRPARLLALERADDDALRAVEHVAELDRARARPG